jgi:glycosyltransferase involved in cell wall biosynthesis
MYMAGPGNVVETFRHWKEGREDPSEVACTYSGQFFDTCRDLGLKALVISHHATAAIDGNDAIRVEHRPIPWSGAPGARYHLGRILYGLQMLVRARQFRAGVLVVSGGTPWFITRLFALLGIRVVPTLHCVLWRQFRPLRPSDRCLNALGRPLFRRSAWAILCLSREIDRQVKYLTGGHHVRLEPFLPSYRRELFDGVPPPSLPARPFLVLYVGRIERKKGVFDLLEVARRLRDAGRTDVEFDLCGAGAALEELRSRTITLGLERNFRSHGHCTRDQMKDRYARCHAVVVPTTRDFEEGFNKVVAEGILAGRPVVTSSVCPALDYVREAVAEVPPDDVVSYSRAVLRLCDDPKYYEARRVACATLREQFFDPARSWGAALRRILEPLLPGPAAAGPSPRLGP